MRAPAQAKLHEKRAVPMWSCSFYVLESLKFRVHRAERQCNARHRAERNRTAPQCSERCRFAHIAHVARPWRKCFVRGLLKRWLLEAAEWGYKPGSVLWTAIYLDCMLPSSSSKQPEHGPGQPSVLLFALASDGVYQAATLPWRWCALTAPFQLFSV